MRGIISAAGYVPYRRLARTDIAAFMGGGGGKGTRAVASHDEDTTTLGVEAARLALRAAPGRTPDSALVRHLLAGLPGQDQRHRGHRRPAPARRRRRLRLRRRPALGHRCAPHRPRAAAAPRWSWRPTSATGCRRAATRPPAATPVRPRWWARAPMSSPSSSAVPRPPTSSPTAGGRRATAPPSSGRSASARTATWRSGGRAGPGARRRPASRPRCRPPRRHRHARTGR